MTDKEEFAARSQLKWTPARWKKGQSGNPSGLPGKPVGARTVFSQGFLRDLPPGLAGARPRGHGEVLGYENAARHLAYLPLTRPRPLTSRRQHDRFSNTQLRCGASACYCS
jgi:hypothetical protein